MATRFVSIDRDTPLLLPPDLREWVPANHLVHFILDAVDALDLRQVKVNTRGTGSEQYPPHMLLGLLLYSYATGTFSRRRIEQSTYDSVPVRLLTADTHPDHDTLCTFRRENQTLLTESFVKVLQLAQQLNVLKLGSARTPEPPQIPEGREGPVPLLHGSCFVVLCSAHRIILEKRRRRHAPASSLPFCLGLVILPPQAV